MEALGDQLLTSVAAVRRSCVFAAPYIKYSSLARLLSACTPTAAVFVVTRWRLDELALGVSDLSVWELVSARPNTQLFLSPNLHAKYYRADDDIWIGSANLTGAALGWSNNPNLEILIPVGSEVPALAQFEASLLAATVAVDEPLYLSFAAALEAYPKPNLPLPETGLVNEGIAFGSWRPSLRFPSDLFSYYRGDIDDLTQAARECAARDIRALEPPLGLDRAAFMLWISQQLRQHPEVQAIVEFVGQSRRFGQMRAFLSDRGAEDGSRDWQSWMRWFELFLPDLLKFHTANYSEIVERA